MAVSESPRKVSSFPSNSSRLFQNHFLERFTHVHPIVPLICWGPVFFIFLGMAIRSEGLVSSLAPFFSGIMAWTLAEYVIHRFLFHFEPKSKAGKRLVFLFHGIHHFEPQDPSRLVMPPIVALTIGWSLYFLLSSLMPSGIFEALFAGLILGYLAYDYLHFAAHHFNTGNPILNYLKRYHLQHHFQNDEAKWGVSSPLWDWVFRTMK